MAEENTELKSAQEKIIALMEKSHAMELKVKDQEMYALKVKHETEGEKKDAEIIDLKKKVSAKDFEIADLQAECAK